MSRKSRRRADIGALELIEQAVHLVRAAPLGTLATYYAGTLPFTLGLLYFWADLSRNPYAQQHAIAAALGMTGLFLWMKFWQAVFAQQLRAQLSGVPAPPLTLARAGRIFYLQTALQPTALFVLPVAAVLTLPFAWAYAFYQSLTAQPDAECPTLREGCQRAWRQARLGPTQNHVLLALMSLFGLFVLVGCGIVGGGLPQLIKMLFGVETVFSRGGAAMLNTTFLMAMLCVAALCVDPILKAIYVLRVFYGESRQSGEDLRAALLTPAGTGSARGPRAESGGPPDSLPPDKDGFGGPPNPTRQRRVLPGSAGRALIAFLLATTALTAPAVDTPPPAAAPIQPQKLDRAITDVIQQRKYTWRMPREKQPEVEAEKKPGVLARFFERVGNLMRDGLRATAKWIERLFQKIFGRLPAPGSPDFGWVVTKQMLLYGLLALVISALAFLAIRFWRVRRRQPAAVTTEAVQSVPDLTDENVAADQLPEDGWSKLARELLAGGEFRLALRAFYLASLAHLAERNLINLARFKSNRDYERELQRRAHAFPNLVGLFGENVSAFDRVWYGRHEATGELVDQFAAKVERIKGGGG
jgi:hypothetical protein